MLVRGPRVNVIVAFMNFEGLLDVHVTERSTTEELFEEFLLRCLMPSLNPFNGFNHRSVVVMDNLSVHKTQDICDMIRQTGALIRFLRVYSPDLNPIEEMFSKVKHYLRLNQAAVISTSQPRLLVLEAFNQVTASDCVGYIRQWIQHLTAKQNTLHMGTVTRHISLLYTRKEFDSKSLSRYLKCVRKFYALLKF